MVRLTGDFLEEFLLTRRDDLCVSHATALVLDAIHLAADALIFFLHLCNFCQGILFCGTFRHRIGFVRRIFVGGSCGKIELLLHFGALTIFPIHLSRFFEATEGLLRR